MVKCVSGSGSFMCALVNVYVSVYCDLADSEVQLTLTSFSPLFIAPTLYICICMHKYSM